MEDNQALIRSYGFVYNGSCHCSGFKTWKYNLKTELGEFKIRLRVNTFQIEKPDSNRKKDKIRWPISELKNILNEIVSTYKISVPQKN